MLGIRKPAQAERVTSQVLERQGEHGHVTGPIRLGDAFGKHRQRLVQRAAPGAGVRELHQQPGAVRQLHDTSDVMQPFLGCPRGRVCVSKLQVDSRQIH